MSESNQTYRIELWCEAYFCKAMDVTDDNLRKACEFAMVHADDDSSWQDTLISSTHWIESVDHHADLVPEECSAAAIRCGGAVLTVYRLREALRLLVQACEGNYGTLGSIARDIERAKRVLAEIPDRVGD
jgi:hypothetical protein